MFPIYKKVKKVAKKSVLSQKLMDKKLIIVEGFKISAPKTKEFSIILNSFDLKNTKKTILLNNIDDNVILGSQNLKNVYLSKASVASTCDMLDCDTLILDKEAANYYNDLLN